MATAYFLAACLELPTTSRGSVSKRPSSLGVLLTIYRICLIAAIV
jgi:hypothetical protein